jgi:hypothetical protein
MDPRIQKAVREKETRGVTMRPATSKLIELLIAPMLHTDSSLFILLWKKVVTDTHVVFVIDQARDKSWVFRRGADLVIYNWPQASPPLV